jgi:CheY-like chemotaxis protein
MMALSSDFSQRFLFAPETLAQKIVQESDYTSTGYWHHRFQSPTQTTVPGEWYLGLLQGRAIFADSRPMSVSRLLAIVERYVPKLRSREAKQIVESLQQKFKPQNHGSPLESLPVFLGSCYDSNLIQPADVKYALRLKLLQDFDDILFDYGGQAEFLPESGFPTQIPISGFELNEVIAEAHRRRLIWGKVKTLIPSSDNILTINEAALDHASLTPQHEKHLRALVSHGQTLNMIAVALAKDKLELAKGLAQLVDKGLLTIQSTVKDCAPEIFIIDDSPLMLRQFKLLVCSWGYRVQSLSDPTKAMDMMTQANPIAIFLDINMPGLSGFDLLKQIRRQPKLATIPLIMLTAERTLSNNWRAQWSGCQFLSKPLCPDEIPKFKQELRMLLASIVA